MRALREILIGWEGVCTEGGGLMGAGVNIEINPGPPGGLQGPLQLAYLKEVPNGRAFLLFL